MPKISRITNLFSEKVFDDTFMLPVNLRRITYDYTTSKLNQHKKINDHFFHTCKST